MAEKLISAARLQQALSLLWTKIKAKAIADLADYYNKAAIDAKVSTLQAAISSIPKFAIEVVTELPTANISKTKVYLLRETGQQAGNIFSEYIRVTDSADNTEKWEKLGEQKVDLSGYAKLSDSSQDILLRGLTTQSVKFKFGSMEQIFQPHAGMWAGPIMLPGSPGTLITDQALNQILPKAGTEAPKGDSGNGAIGTSPKFAREDHVHPSDTSRAKKNGDSTEPFEAQKLIVATNITLPDGASIGASESGGTTIFSFASQGTVANLPIDYSGGGPTIKTIAYVEDFSEVTEDEITSMINSLN